MTRKLGVAHKLARLLPAIRRLHDSALEANIRLDNYVQENEKLRAFMAKESEKTQKLYTEQSSLQGQVAKLEALEVAIKSEREKNEKLSDKIKSLELKAGREKDLRRLQENLSSGYAVLQTKYNSKNAEYRLAIKSFNDEKNKFHSEISQLKADVEIENTSKLAVIEEFNVLQAEVQRLEQDLVSSENTLASQKEDFAVKESEVEAKLSEINNLNLQLAEASGAIDIKSEKIDSLDQSLIEKLNEIDVLTSEMQTLSLQRNQQVTRSLELEGIIEDKNVRITQIEENLEVVETENITLAKALEASNKLSQEETQKLDAISSQLKIVDGERADHVKRLLHLEQVIQDNQAKLDSRQIELTNAETRFQEQLNRSIELERIISENSSELESSKRELTHSETRFQEQLNRSIELERIISENSSELEKSKQELKHSETRFQEQLNRSIELESMIVEKSSELEALKVKLGSIEVSREEQIERSLYLERVIQNHVEEKEKLTSEFTAANNNEVLLSELKQKVEQLSTELNVSKEKLHNAKHQLNDTQHYANIRSEEALARILGKLTQIDHSGSRTPILDTNNPLTNYSAQEIALGKYFDLLIGTLTGTLIEDEPISPWSEGGYDPEVRSLGRDWPATACSMIGTVRMTSLQRLVCDVIENDVPGDAIETGVWRGGACILMKSIFEVYGCKDRKVWVADSFQGLPKPNADDYNHDADDPHHTFEPLRVSKEQVADNFRKFGVLDDNVKFLKGWFKDTLHKAPIDKLAILRLDGDMEESTLQALNALYHKVSKGGYVIIDDYGLGPCRKAVDSFRDKHNISSPLFEVDAACVYWQVE